MMYLCSVYSINEKSFFRIMVIMFSHLKYVLAPLHMILMTYYVCFNTRVYDSTISC